MSRIAKNCLLILFVSIHCSYGQGISVSPSRLFFKGQPGETVSQMITFSNTSKSEFNFTSALKDWNRDSAGVKRYFPMGQLKNSNGHWLSLSTNSLSLAPGETREVSVSMQIPKDGSASQLSNSMLFFTQVQQQRKSTAGKAGVGINILFEVGIQIYHVPSGLAPGDLEFLAFEDKKKSVTTDSLRKMAIKIKNSGSINKDAYVRFELTNTSSGEEIKVDPIAIAMLPNAEQWVELNLPAKLKGKFLVVAILDAGSQYDLKVAEKEITY